eukprot:TRINITY_DN4876_c1_g1_i1.p1 TRINITY_DN4876_c1_g1~~TRINITY_DN4876_c1_g1_i1.p1  ORF type:complete len:283 (-),score=51.91 TRINITY_DN4876_c1_g1_i1:109-957(-)
MSAVAGAMACVLPMTDKGTIELSEIKKHIREEDEHFPHSKLIILENTANMAGGISLTPEYIQSVATLAHEHGMKLHVDGARLFNASAELKVTPAELCKGVDSVTFCFYKALCAPGGAVLCGSTAYIKKCRRKRKMLGGVMRQSGTLAAACLVGLSLIDDIELDHQRARDLAEQLRKIPTIEVQSCHTNFVWIRPRTSVPLQSDSASATSPICPSADSVPPSISNLPSVTSATVPDFVLLCEKENVKVVNISGRLRLVTHRHIDDHAIDTIVRLCRKHFVVSE